MARCCVAHRERGADLEEFTVVPFSGSPAASSRRRRAGCRGHSLDPEAALPGAAAAAAGVEHRHWRIVAVQPVAGEDMGAKRFDQRRHQRRGTARPSRPWSSGRSRRPPGHRCRTGGRAEGDRSTSRRAHGRRARVRACRARSVGPASAPAPGRRSRNRRNAAGHAGSPGTRRGRIPAPRWRPRRACAACRRRSRGRPARASSAFQKPSAPSPTATLGATARPRAFSSTRSSRQLCALSRVPTWKPRSSFLPSGVAPMMTRRHSASGSMRAWR
jgi:hypothetical protein